MERKIGEVVLNPAVAAISDSATLRVSSRAKELRKVGRKIYDFGAGEPDCDTPDHIKYAAVKALEAAETKYTPAAGLPALQAAIAEKLQHDNGLSYLPGQIIISNGAKHSLFNTFLTIVSPGDEVIIPAPYWLSYPEMVRVAGGVPVFVHGAEADDFKITAEQLARAITPRTRAVVVNSPSNPVGHVYTRQELAALAEVAAAHGLYIVADEIYEKMMYDGAEHVSLASLSPAICDLTITVNGFSKAYAMTGWRLGYVAAPVRVAKAITALQSHSTSAPNTFAQYGGLEALKADQGCVATMLAAFAERRAILYARLIAMPGVTCVKPMGAFYMLPNIARCGMDSATFAERLLEEEGVALVPGVAFGADTNVRLSYACSIQNIEEGMDRMAAFVRRHQGP
jgi:aspartate aminotransferase